MQQFVSIGSGEKLTDSRQEIINNDLTVMSCNSGTSFPTTNIEVGMFCLRTDLNQLFQLMDLTPTWKMVFDLSKTATNKEYVDTQVGAKVDSSKVVTVATANKILQLDASGNLPANITGNAASASTAPWGGLSGVPSAFTPPIASASVLGGVKQGTGCTIAADGTLSVSPPAAPVIVSSIPLWLRSFGTGADGVYSSTGSASLGGEYWFTDFTLNAGHAISVPSPGLLIIRATNSITIAGTISAVGVGPSGAGGVSGQNSGTNGNTGSPGSGGGSGGGGGHSGASDSAQGGYGGTSLLGNNIYLGMVGGGAGGRSSGAGSPGGTPSSAHIKALSDMGVIALGAGGGSGEVYSSNTSGSGGAGGGCIVLVAPTITFTGAVSAAGGNGYQGGQYTGGGGGGGGGLVTFAARNYATWTGTINVNGGSGGPGNGGSSRYGGNGGAGWYMVYTIS